jgi:hypothetical protein
MLARAHHRRPREPAPARADFPIWGPNPVIPGFFKPGPDGPDAMQAFSGEKPA